MKKFRVSLGLLKQCNFEIEVEAKNEKEAAKEAARIWEESDGDEKGEIVDYDEASITIDYNVEDDIGVDVEEVENGN